MKIVEYNKLVRDKIPEIIESDSKKCVLKKVTGQEKLNYLIKKLFEEANELSKLPSIEELVDVQEVIISIANELGISLDELESARLMKKNERGSFERGIVLLQVKQ